MDESRGADHNAAGVPYQVKQLARMVSYGFYGKEHGLIVDMLCKHSIVKEEILEQNLLLEKKHIRQLLATLKIDQIVKTKMVVESLEDGTSLRCNYHFLEYPSLLNLVKYKLDLMRRKLETEERNAANRASFSCRACKKMYSDLEANQLFDFTSQKFLCTFCGEEVEEAEVAPEQSQKVMMAHFNEKLGPFFDLVREIDSLNLSPAELQADLSGTGFANAMKANSQAGASGSWNSGREVNYNYIPQNIVIDLNSTEVKAQKPREQPIWLTQSTVMTEENHIVADAETDSGKAPDSGLKDAEVMAVLMKHESEVYEDEKVAAPTPDDDEQDNDEDMEDVESRDREAEAGLLHNQRIRVGNKYYTLDEIDDDIAQQMTEDEKANYIRIGQEAYADMMYE